MKEHVGRTDVLGAAAIMIGVIVVLLAVP